MRTTPILIALTASFILASCRVFTDFGDFAIGDAGIRDGSVDANTMVDASTECATLDEPDANATDANCDGIDGTVSDAIFVSGSAGDDGNVRTMAAPVKTISHAIELASAGGKHSVIVATGAYTEAIVLVKGIGIHGGYNRADNWKRSLSVLETQIIAPTSPALQGTAIDVETRVTGLSIVAPSFSSSASSIAVRLLDATLLSIEDCELAAGDGGKGADGTTPATIPQGGNPGQTGEVGHCYGNASGCGGTGSSTASGRTGGTAVCGCGAGGNSQNSTTSSNPGPAGLGGTYVDSNGACVTQTSTGLSSSGGAAHVSSYANPGNDGAPGAPGGAGARSEWTDNFLEAGYTPSSAQPGGLGRPGGGGGGGGAVTRRICSDGTSILVQSAGGSGGSGGCGGAGGTGGVDGGASIGLYLWRSSPQLIRTTISSAHGGAGGTGASGHAGGTGGAYGGGGSNGSGTCPDGAAIVAAGGSGGRGGDGGQGGQGGGAAGGVSVGVVYGDASMLSASSSNVTVGLTNAMAGAGGGGAQSGPVGVVCMAYRVSGAMCLNAL